MATPVRIGDLATTPRPRLKSLPRGFRLACWARPRRLSPTSQDLLYSTLVHVSTQSFGADMTPYWQGRRAGGYFQQITRFFFICDHDGQVIGWTGYHRRSLGGRLCIYLDSTGVLPVYQGDGIVSEVQSRVIGRELAMRPLSTLCLITRTENPVVYRMLRRAVGPGNVFPSPQAPVPAGLQKVGAGAAQWLGQAAVFDAPSLKVSGAYANLDALYGELPKSGEADLDEFFARSLRPVDAFLVIARANFFKVLPFVLARRLYRPRPAPDTESSPHGAMQDRTAASSKQSP